MSWTSSKKKEIVMRNMFEVEWCAQVSPIRMVPLKNRPDGSHLASLKRFSGRLFSTSPTTLNAFACPLFPSHWISTTCFPDPTMNCKPSKCEHWRTNGFSSYLLLATMNGNDERDDWMAGNYCVVSFVFLEVEARDWLLVAVDVIVVKTLSL